MLREAKDAISQQKDPVAPGQLNLNAVIVDL